MVVQLGPAPPVQLGLVHPGACRPVQLGLWFPMRGAIVQLSLGGLPVVSVGHLLAYKWVLKLVQGSVILEW